MDGLIIANIRKELEEALVGKRINKIFQPKKDEIILHIHSYRLLMAAGATAPGLYLTKEKYENPEKAPMFCMLLRKHALGKIVAIKQPHFERIIELEIEAMDELRELSIKRLIIEIMGKHSNIILVNDKGTVVDSIKHINPATSIRPILPGFAYEAPPSQGKINFLHFDKDTFSEPMAYTGISPAIAKNYNTAEKMEQLLNIVKTSSYKPYIIKTDNRKAFKGIFNVPTYFPEDERTYFNTISEAVEEFYKIKEQGNRLNQKTGDLQKIVKQSITRCIKKAEKFKYTLEEIKEREKLKLYGELITANIYQIEQGEESTKVTNYYDNTEITIPLDSKKTPTENAQSYFKQYTKQKRQYASILEQQKENEQTLAYLESVLSALQTELNEAEIEEVREELEEEKIIKKRKRMRVNSRSSFLKFETEDGYTILIGKNNKQNDELTKNATPNDIWLHTKDIPGSHVIIRAEGGREVSQNAIEKAAGLAAFYSKARNSSLVAVDYCLKKYVKKPNGAKPGMVIYTDFKTAFVSPEI
ncbi:MAG: NFACT family protein [Defluviitaleaceae bacterium]|nr:NFACT family protein [Defluviitaleaceae bacterium]